MSIKGRIYSIETFGTVDGPGIRYVVFLQGCPLRCQYCHNRDSWDPKGGTETTVEELVNDIKKYTPFMQASGGGVTLSGGEPTLQLSFVTALAKELKALGIHVALDTSGFVAFEAVKDLINYVDLVLLDLKEMNPTKHRALTSVDNQKILDFAQAMSNHNIPLWIRHVVVPGVTDSKADLVSLAQYLQGLKTVERVDLLPYHSMGKFKWKRLELDYPLEAIPDATDSDIQKAASILREYGLNTKSSVVA